jgi:hypothetical protein
MAAFNWRYSSLFFITLIAICSGCIVSSDDDIKPTNKPTVIPYVTQAPTIKATPVSTPVPTIEPVIIKPSINITYIPKFDSGETLKGTVTGFKDGEYKVLIYAFVSGWYNMPYSGAPVTSVDKDGNWICDISKGNGRYASRFSVFLVPVDYSPPLMQGGMALPDELIKISVSSDHKSIAVPMKTGTYITRTTCRSLGVLKVENKGNYDAVAVVVNENNPKVPVISVYIKAKDTFEIQNVPDGVFLLYFNTGEGWDDYNKRFMKYNKYIKLDSKYEFKATATTYIIWTITLYPADSGNIRIYYINDSDFPGL